MKPNFVLTTQANSNCIFKFKTNKVKIENS